VHALAKAIVVATALAFTEEDIETLGHVDAEEFVRVAHEGGEKGENDGFGDAMRCQMLAAEGLDLEVVADDKGAVETLQTLSGHSKHHTSALTPKSPMRMKKPTSKKCQSRSYETWKSTSLPVRKGFMA
jgi:hypothetical protein